MSKGLEIRAQIDTENVRGLLLINGGGAVALLAFLPTVIGHESLKALAFWILIGLGCFQFGLLLAVLHNGQFGSNITRLCRGANPVLVQCQSVYVCYR